MRISFGGDTMLNAFKTLLKKELGNSKYMDYFEEYRRMDQLRKAKGEKIQIGGVYDAIYEDLKDAEHDALLEKQKRLRETMMMVFQICRHYTLIVFTYLVASLVIIFWGDNVVVDLLCILALSGVFLYKTYEFVVNKYSYLDAYIIIAYKAALEKCIKEKDKCANLECL